MSSHHRHMGGSSNDEKLESALHEIYKNISINRNYDIPYLAGYSNDGHIIYIDRDMPEGFMYRNKFVSTDRFLIVHESVEKSLMMLYHLHYLHAHQIAICAESFAVQTEIGPNGLAEYNNFMNLYVKEIWNEKIRITPIDLDYTPYLQYSGEVEVEKLKSTAGTI